MRTEYTQPVNLKVMVAVTQTWGRNGSKCISVLNRIYCLQQTGFQIPILDNLIILLVVHVWIYIYRTLLTWNASTVLESHYNPLLTSIGRVLDDVCATEPFTASRNKNLECQHILMLGTCFSWFTALDIFLALLIPLLVPDLSYFPPPSSSLAPQMPLSWFRWERSEGERESSKPKRLKNGDDENT